MVPRGQTSHQRQALTLQSEGVFRILVEGVRDYAIFLLDPEGNVVTWNPAAERIKGYSADDIVGKHFSTFYPEADKLAGKPAYELNIAAEKGRFEDENWRIRKDGSRFWASVVITKVVNESGGLIGFGKITRDLTERRLAELRYRLLVEGVSDYAIFSLDPKGHVTSWNTGAQRIKGYADFEIMGEHFSRFYLPEDRAAGLPEHVLHTATESGHYEGEGWRVRKDGTRFWASVVVTPIRNDQGEIIGYRKITRDVTDRKNLLEKSDTMLRNWSSGWQNGNRPMQNWKHLATRYRMTYGPRCEPLKDLPRPLWRITGRPWIRQGLNT